MPSIQRLPTIAGPIAACCVLWCCTVASADPYGEAVLADRPIAYYRFNETSGETAIDATGNGHDGVYRGEIALGERSAYPHLGTAAAFGGKDGHVRIPADNAFKFGTGDFSIEFWFNCRETLSTRGDIFTYKGAGKDFGILKPLGNANLIAIARPYRPFQAQTDSFSIGAWHHAAYVRQAGIDRWHIDGALSGTATGHRQAIDMNVDILIGINHLGDLNRIDTKCAWNGLIDELAIYGSALQERQIELHYRTARQSPR